jgi:hypothetical protein
MSGGRGKWGGGRCQRELGGTNKRASARSRPPHLVPRRAGRCSPARPSSRAGAQSSPPNQRGPTPHLGPLVPLGGVDENTEVPSDGARGALVVLQRYVVRAQDCVLPRHGHVLRHVVEGVRHCTRQEQRAKRIVGEEQRKQIVQPRRACCAHQQPPSSSPHQDPPASHASWLEPRRAQRAAVLAERAIHPSPNLFSRARATTPQCRRAAPARCRPPPPRTTMAFRQRPWQRRPSPARPPLRPRRSTTASRKW